MPGQGTQERTQQPAGKGHSASAACTAFLKAKCGEGLLQVLQRPEQEASHSVLVSLLDLCHHDAGLANRLLAVPQQGLAHLTAAAHGAQAELHDALSPSARAQVKAKLQVRLAGLVSHLDAEAAAADAPSLGQLRAGHLHRLLAFAGTVVRTGPVQALELQRLFECRKCRHRFLVSADLQQYAKLDPPTACPAGGGGECPGTSFSACADTPPRHIDYQEVRLQERVQCLGPGAVPAAVTALLLGDLVDTVQPGGDVELTGVVLGRWKPCFPEARCALELAVLANSLAPCAAAKARPGLALSPDLGRHFEAFWDAHRGCPLRGRNALVASVCPQLHGLASVKLATLLMLIGGVEQQGPRGGRVRGTVHMLLVGDPGTGKSQIMKAAAQLSPRAVVTSGRSSTAAGLTASAVKEGGQWALAAGALVLADGGLCCIDEFDGLSEGDRTTLHEAMEQQTVSVAKAGLVTTLGTRTAVLGVQNPKGAFDPRHSLAVNTGLSEPLLSRFDIVLILRDLRQAEWDAEMCDHLLGEGDEAGAGPGASPGSVALSADSAANPWPAEALRQYVAWVRGRLRPVAGPEAERLLLGYWHRQRGAADRQAARTTVRALESLMRLAQAHARLMCRGTVTAEDAAAAILLAEEATPDSVILGGHSTMHSRLGADPDAEMREHAAVLERVLFGQDDFVSSSPFL